MEASWNIKHQALHSDSQNLVANYLLRTVPRHGMGSGSSARKKAYAQTASELWRSFLTILTV